MSPLLRIAPGEYDTGWHSPDVSLSRARELAMHAAASGAQLVALPEMCTSGFVMNPAKYAEPIDGHAARELSSIARDAGVHLLAGVATRAVKGEQERYYNSALLFAPDGSLIGEYRKQRLFAYAREHHSYSAGDAPLIATIGGVRIAPLICFDLRFPELFAAVAPFVDAIVVIANWPTTRQSHWDLLLRARAIDAQTFVVGVNRTGRGGSLDYEGHSAAWSPWGEPVALANGLFTVDAAEVGRIRTEFPLVEDRRGEV